MFVCRTVYEKIKKADITFAAHCYNVNVLLSNINVKNFHGSLTTVVRGHNYTTKTANITDTIFDRTLV